jgi:hypothetical protein
LLCSDASAGVGWDAGRGIGCRAWGVGWDAGRGWRGAWDGM